MLKIVFIEVLENILGLPPPLKDRFFFYVNLNLVGSRLMSEVLEVSNSKSKY